jgi:hypothetical protein
MASLTGIETKLIACYLRHADQNGVAFPSAKTLGEYLGVDPRNIKRARVCLKTKGLLKQVGGGRGIGDPGKFQLLMPTVLTPQNNPQPVTKSTTSDDFDTGDDFNPEPVTISAQTGDDFNHPKYPMNYQGSTTTTGDGLSGVANGDAEKEEFLGACGVNLNRKVRDALPGWTLAELKATWTSVVNGREQKKRCGAMARAVMDSDKSMAKSKKTTTTTTGYPFVLPIIGESSDKHTPAEIDATFPDNPGPYADKVLRYRIAGAVHTHRARGNPGVDPETVLRGLGIYKPTPEQIEMVQSVIEETTPLYIKAMEAGGMPR